MLIKLRYFLVVGFCAGLIGCGGTDITETDETSTDTPDITISEPPAVPAESAEERASEFELQPAGNAPAPVTTPEANAPAPTDSTSTKAGAGVGAKGQGYGGGLVSEPARQYFRAQERIVFDVQIPQALKLYKATEGNNPKTQAEFMEKIVKANSINLPELPEGSTYAYDAKAGELMVTKGI